VLKSQRKTAGVGILIAEAVLIMMSVALGLMANEWRVGRENEKEAVNALEFIREEIEGNQERIEEILPYHERMADSLSVLMNRVFASGAKISTREMFTAMPSGFSTPLISRNSWELVNQTGAINHVDFDLAISLSRLYDLQAFYQQKIDLIGQNVYVAGNINSLDQGSAVIAFGLLANDIAIQERRLLKQYPAMVARLDSLMAVYAK